MRRLLATKTRVELVERGPRTSPGVRSRGTWELDGQHHGLAWGGRRPVHHGRTVVPPYGVHSPDRGAGGPLEEEVDTGAEVRRPVTMAS